MVDTIQRDRAILFGVQYTDAEGEQGMISETEVSEQPDGSWAPGRTHLYRTDGSYPGQPFAFGGW
jgi:serine/threonine protein kinase HipA of HipAB toxin-antitoxin module